MAKKTLRRQSLRGICPLLVCAYLFQSSYVAAAQANRHSDNPLRGAVRQAVELAYPGVNVDQLNLSERDDLDSELSQIAAKTTLPVSFYSYAMDSSADDGSLWVVVLGNSPLGSDELYSFENSDGIEQSSQKFNRLLSHLTLSLSNEQAARVARFFLACCVRGTPGETVTDEIGLRHSVERYYIGLYGDVWRALEAGAEWWEGYQKNALPLSPTLAVEGGVRRIVLNRLVVSFGMHPQLQQWHLAVSSDGNIRVLAVDSIFPKQRRWLSYAFRTNLAGTALTRR